MLHKIVFLKPQKQGEPNGGGSYMGGVSQIAQNVPVRPFFRTSGALNGDQVGQKRTNRAKKQNGTFGDNLGNAPICNPPPFVGNRPNTVSESMVSDTELSESFCPHRIPGRELGEFLSAYYWCAEAHSPSFSKNSPSLPQNSVRVSLQNSTLETVSRAFPNLALLNKSGPG